MTVFVHDLCCGDFLNQCWGLESMLEHECAGVNKYPAADFHTLSRYIVHKGLPVSPLTELLPRLAGFSQKTGYIMLLSWNPSLLRTLVVGIGQAFDFECTHSFCFGFLVLAWVSKLA